MSSTDTRSVCAAAEAAVVSAIGVPPDENGLGLITELLTSCMEAAAEAWPDEQFDFWLQVANRLSMGIRGRSDAAALFQVPRAGDATYLTLIKKRGLFNRSQELDAVLGRAICVAACTKHTLNVLVPDGLAGIGKRLMGQISRDPNWKLVHPSNVMDRQAITNLTVELPSKSPVRRFCVEIAGILSSPILPGIAVSTPNGMRTAADETATLGALNSPGVEFTQRDHQELDDEDRQELDTSPDIAKRLPGIPGVTSHGIFNEDDFLN